MPYWKKSDNKKTLDDQPIEAGKIYLGVSTYGRLEEFDCDISHVEDDGSEWLELRENCNGNVGMLDFSYHTSDHYPVIEKK